MNPSDKRAEAIRLIMDRYVDTNGNRLILDIGTNRMDLADHIAILARAGKTERWLNAIRRWEGMVRNTENDLDWAMLQGQIYALYAA